MNIKGENNHIIIRNNQNFWEVSADENIEGFSEIVIDGNNNTIELEFPLHAEGEFFTNNRIRIFGRNHYCHICSTFKFHDNFIDFFEENASLYIGRNTSVRNTGIALSYKSDIYIGEGCMIAESNIRGSDFHPIIDIETNKVINIPSQRLYIGNHVWLAERSRILKNAYIPDGCIVGAEAVIAKKFEESNCIIAGNPAKIIKKNITWDRYNYTSYSEFGPFKYR